MKKNVLFTLAIFLLLLSTANAGRNQDGFERYYTQVLENAISSIEKADLPNLAEKEPFKAAQYMQVASLVQRLKREIFADHPDHIAPIAKEIEIRLDVLKDGKIDSSNPGFYDLLELAAIPESQIIIEYLAPPNARSAYITFTWGSIPLVIASVGQFSTDTLALTNMKLDGGFYLPYGRETTCAGLPASIVTEYATVQSGFKASEFKPEAQVIGYRLKRSEAFIIEKDWIKVVRPSAFVILPDCTDTMRKEVEKRSEELSRPIIGIEEALKSKDTLVIAGDFRKLNPALRIVSLGYVKGVFGPAKLKVAAGKRVITIQAPSVQIAEHAARLIAEGKPVQPAEVDALRKEIVACNAPDALLSPKPQPNLYAGDVHMHTNYSDGKVSPSARCLSVLYAGEDFAIVTDHNRLDGVQLAVRQFADSKIAFPITVGEEITHTKYHMNAYPVTSEISWKLSPEDAIKAAREQGAAIQWNHPGFPDSDWGRPYLDKGIAELGLDAWEHWPEHYFEWKADGTLPVIVGSTDTHDNSVCWDERTIVFAKSPSGADIADAVKKGRVVAVLLRRPELFIGSDEMVAKAWSALAEGNALKSAKAERIKGYFKDADVPSLLRSEEPVPPVRDFDGWLLPGSDE